jgi:type IV pilus assembly protein PilC
VEFEYTALDSKGKKVSGKEEAEDRYEATAALKARGLTPLDVKEPTSDTTSSHLETKSFKLEPFGISLKTVAIFTRQLGELMEAGIPITKALNSLERYSPSEKFRKVLNEISRDLREGNGLHESMAKHEKVFGDVYLGMIKVGETSGHPEQMVMRLADFLEAEMDLRGQLKSALTYPIFVLSFSLVLVYAMVAYLLPGFEPMWTSAGLDISKFPVTVMLMKMSAITKNVWDEILVLVLVAAGVSLGKALLNTTIGAKAADTAMYKLPVLGHLVQLTVTSRVANTMSTLMASGVTALETVEMAARTAGNHLAREDLEQVATDIRQGVDLPGAFERTTAFPQMMLQMVAVGQQSGKMAHMMDRIARYYQRQLDSAVKGIAALVEPLTMVLVGGVVFIFVLGVFMPIMGIVGALQGQM